VVSGCMSRKVAAFVAGVLDAANALQPARQRGKTIANLMVALEARGARTVDTPHGTLKFLAHRGRHVGGAVDNFFGNEPETVAWIDAMAPGEVLWDIGGAFGQFALYAGRRGLKVVAFEPKANSYGLLVEHIALNGLGDQITALPLALSDKGGLTGLHLMDMTAGSALNTLAGSLNQHGQLPDAFTQPVIATTMDEAATTWDLPRPDHIKLDVDGVEAWIIRGGPQMLEGARSLLIEIYGSDAAGLEAEVGPLIAAAGLSEDLAFRGRGSKRNRLYQRG
jgi:FkbM family methyltransferase